MDLAESKEISVKTEPSETINGCTEEADSQDQVEDTLRDTSSVMPGPLRYVSRRGRPPGGGYSMKSQGHYVSFSSTSLPASDSLGRQTLNGSSPGLIQQDMLKAGTGTSTDNSDVRRYGFPGLDVDRNSYRCDGCDVVFSSRDTYAMHMLLRAKNESCVALPTSAISSNPENPTPREKFERELRQQAMLTALRSQVATMTKAASATMPRSGVHAASLRSVLRSVGPGSENSGLAGGGCVTDFNNYFSVDAYGLYLDPRRYRRILEEFGFRATCTGSMETMMEQLSCKECGEIFTSKDALAMHVMFHTRDEEKEPATCVTWADMRTRSDQKETNHWISSASSTISCPEAREAGRTELNPPSKGETNKSEVRELTAERVAELKRMAIESSLRSPLKKTPSSREPTRSKSVSQVTSARSSAQARPLSADDARRFNTPESSYASGAGSSMVFRYNNCQDQSEARVQHKRPHSALEDDVCVPEAKQPFLGPFKSEKSRYDRTLYNIFCRSNKPMYSPGGSKAEKPDTDFSSAPDAGPENHCNKLDQDGSGCTSATDKDEQATDYSKSRSIPCLDAIMSQNAVLVPLELSTNRDDSDEVTEDRNVHTENNSRPQASALDFSIGHRDSRDVLSRDVLSRDSWCTPHSNSRDDQQHARLSFLSSDASQKTGRNEDGRNFFPGHEKRNSAPFDQKESRRQWGDNRLSSMSRQAVSTDNTHKENEDAPRNWLDDSAARVGEARYCPHCEILFLDATLFHLHMGLHNVNNPWQCNTCGLVCSGRLDFSTHVLHY